jgi:hypothetical protein
MDLGLDMAVGEHRLPKQLVNVGHDMGGIQQVAVGQLLIASRSWPSSLDHRPARGRPGAAPGTSCSTRRRRSERAWRGSGMAEDAYGFGCRLLATEGFCKTQAALRRHKPLIQRTLSAVDRNGPVNTGRRKAPEERLSAVRAHLGRSTVDGQNGGTPGLQGADPRPESRFAQVVLAEGELPVSKHSALFSTAYGHANSHGLFT